jgi:hypothetical protein
VELPLLDRTPVGFTNGSFHNRWDLARTPYLDECIATHTPHRLAGFGQIGVIPMIHTDR